TTADEDENQALHCRNSPRFAVRQRRPSRPDFQHRLPEVKPVTCSAPARWLFASVSALTLAGASLADNWPQWRGPTCCGICTDTGLPTEWSETKNIAWRLPMPAQAGSTPAIWDDRIFLTSEDGPEVVLMCVSTEGKELWRKSLGTHNAK